MDDPTGFLLICSSCCVMTTPHNNRSKMVFHSFVIAFGREKGDVPLFLKYFTSLIFYGKKRRKFGNSQKVGRIA